MIDTKQQLPVLDFIMGEERHLPMINFIKNYYQDQPLYGAEIGIFAGEGSLFILKNLNIELLYLIDPYDIADSTYVDLNKSRLSSAQERAIERLSNYHSDIEWINLPSNEAIGYIEHKLDFVYIDGNHDYQHTKDDIEHYIDIVKINGWVGGHDYTTGHAWKDGEPIYVDGKPMLMQVKDAVDEYVSKHNLELHIAFEPQKPETGIYRHPDWWFQKV